MKRRVVSFIIILALCLNLCPTWALAAASTEIVTLFEDESYSFPYEVSSPMRVDTAAYTLTGTGTTAILVTGTGVLTLSGTVVSQKGAGVEVQSGGKLYLENPISITGTTYALDIAAGADVKLAPGVYRGNTAAIHVAGGNYAALLENGCAFFDASGDPISPGDLANLKDLTIKQCTNHAKESYTAVAGTPTHTWTCPYCGTKETEMCTFSFDADGAGSCDQCSNELTIAVDESKLPELVYDGTAKPQDVDVTVTLNGDKNLVRDVDFRVDVVPRIDAGQATVTVTGITFNVTFVKTYTVEQDKPGLSWADSTPVVVNYDGASVEASDLPAVNINIQSLVDNLQGYLQYSYKKQDDTDYTSGLPRDAGTYEVIASLPELPNFEGAVSDPITLTINPIAPITMAPVATKPTYNRNPQELVTAGVLNPVALADGLEIQFSTEENGTYSTDIPTATDAGDYTVWYQVTGLTNNYIAPDPNPSEISGVKIQRKAITPVVTLSQYSYLYDGGYKEPAVTVKDDDRVTDLPDTEYKVNYENNRNVSTEAAPAKVVVTDSDANGGNYTLEEVQVEFRITSKTQDTLSITNKPSTFTYGDKFTLGTSGGSGNGLVTWAITSGTGVATVDANSGQVTITGHGSVTVKATKSGEDPDTNVVNYEDAIATWTFTADKKPVTATVTAEDKTYNGDNIATVHAVVENGVLPGDEITITGLTGTFDNENAGADKTVTVDTTGASITGKNSEHYAVTYSATTVQATIRKAVAQITTPPGSATLTYNGTAQALIGTGAVVDPNSVQVEYALSETGPYSTDFPKGTNAGTYTVWYRVQETGNYTGLAPESVDATINKKSVNPTITLDQDTFIYNGTAKEPVVTLYEADGTTVIHADEYTVAYSGNVNVGTATVTATAKADGNYSFALVTKNFTINKEQAKVITAPKPAGDPLTFSNRAQALVIEGTGTGGTMVYFVEEPGGTTYSETVSFSEGIPTRTNAGDYTVYYKVQGDANHSDSDVGHVQVTIAPKTVNNPTIELLDGTNPLVSYTYDGTVKEPKVEVKDGSTVIGADEYNIVYSDNRDAGHGTVNITDKPGGNYTVTGSATFVINKADIVDPAPSAATLTYNGTAQELLTPGTTTGGTVLYALNSATSTFTDAIPTGVNAGSYNVYYKVTGDNNHNDLPVQGPVAVTIGRKQLTDITIDLTPNRFQYDGAVHLPTVTVKDGDTVLPASEYSWACNVPDPKDGGTYTITVSDKTGGNYDLSGANPNTATFTIGQAPQAELVIEGKPEQVYYGYSFKLTANGGSGSGTVAWAAVGGNADIDTDGNVTIKGVGEVTINVVKAGDANYQQASAQWTFTAAPKPVTATVTVSNKPYDGNTTATVASTGIATIHSDTVTITPSSIKATFDDPHAGTGKTVTLDTSNVQVTGDDAAKYAISYPATVTADITQATTTVDTAPAAIDPLTYNGQPQALVTAGQTNVGFLVYSLDGTNFSREIPTGTNAGTYNVYYKVDETADYTGVAVNATPIPVTIDPKDITSTVKIALSETSYRYDGTKQTPKVTLKDGDTVIPESQYDVKWAGPENQLPADLLKAVGTYTATIKNVTGGNYKIDVTASVEITPAEQAALHITGNPEHVYYGDVITTLGTTGGTGEGTVKWSVTAGEDIASFDANTNVLKITGVGAVTVRAERTVPNYGTVGDNWNFTVEPRPVTAEVTITSKTYDGNKTATVASVTVPTINGDTVTIDPASITATFDDPNVGTGKTVTLDDTSATKTDSSGKYAVSYPATAKGDINPKNVTVSVTLSDHDLQGNATDGYYYEYDGAEKKPAVKVTADDDNATLAASDYEIAYANNKNVSTTTEKAAVTVTAKDGGNYTFTPETVHFEIRSAAAMLVSSPQAKDLTYEKGTKQELVTVGVATGGTVVYALKAGNTEPADSDYSETIPQAENAGTYTVYYMVKGDANHDDTTLQQMTATIKPREFTPTITLSGDGLTEANGVYSYTYDGTAKTPTVTVKDGTETIGTTEYSVSYRDNVNAGTATVIVSDANGGNYTVNGTASFTITKVAPTVNPPTEKTDLRYSGEAQELVNAGVTSHGTVVYSVDGGNYSPAIPTAYAVGTYTIDWKVQGDANHSDTTPATLTVKIDKNTVTNPTITLSSDQFKYNGSQQKPDIAVYDNSSRLIPEHEYTVTITGTNGNVGMVNVDTYTVTVAAATSSNYEFKGTLTRTFQIVAADQETISITGTPAQVRYGDAIRLGVSGGTGSGMVKWEITGNTDTTLTQNGLLTVKDVNASITVTVTRTKDNYGDVSASWEFTAAKKPVTAVLAGVDRDYIAGNTSATVKAKVEASDLVFGDTFSIPDLTGTFDNENVGTNKTITITGSAPTITDPKAANYEITYPATTTASILAVAATVATEPAANTLTYDASQSQALVTAGTATGGTMVYSLDGTNFTPAIPKGKDAGKYTVYYKAQGDQNHTDSETKTVDVTIAQQTVAAADLQIELSPPSAQYDGSVHQPAVTLRDAANNVIPTSEYKVTYDTEGGTKNWKDQSTYKVKVENIPGGNYIIADGAEAEFKISTSAQAPLEIVNKPGLVYYGDTFTLSATGGSGNEKVTWNSSDENIAHVDNNGLVTIKGTGPVTITATKAGGGNYEEATATYLLNALKKPVTAIVTAENRVYVSGNTNATIHVTWRIGDLINGDTIQFNPAPTGTFDSDAVGTNKQVSVNASVVNDTTAQKYDITIPPTTTASILKADAAAPNVTAVSDLKYTGSAQALVKDGDTNTLYSTSKDGVYSTTVPTGTNAGTYTVWYKAQGDANHNDSEPQSIQVTISPKTLTLTAADIELSGSDLKTDNGTYYYDYDGTEKTPTVTIKDGAAVIAASEYTVTYSDNKNVTTADKKATVTITDNEGGNYTVSGSATFEIRAGSAELTGSPQDRNLTYNGEAQELVTVGTATGGHIEYKLTIAPTGETTSTSFSMSIPTGTNAGAYTVEYKVVGDDNHNDGPTGSVTVTIQPKTVISPKITVTGTYTYDGTEQKPTGTAVTVEDGNATIDTGEYTLSYRDNVNAGTATVIITDNNGGNYTVNGTATFTIAQATATVDTAPTGKTDLKYNGTAQELLDTLGTATGGTMVYSLDQNGEYSAAIPTGKDVDTYTVWYKVLGDANHSDSTATALSPKVKIDKNTVTNPTIQVDPSSVKYTGEKQTPTVTVKDNNGLLIDGSEYTAQYTDAGGNDVTNNLTAVGTYTLTITGVTDGNYTFETTDGKNTATFEILPADQTPLTITGTRERVYYGDTIQLGATGGVSGGTVTWDVGSSTIASINANTGLLNITGVGSVTVTATSQKTGYNHQTAVWNLYAEKKPVTAVVTAKAKDYDGTEAAAVTATLQTSDFVGADRFTITLNGCTFEDANAGTDKKVNVVSANPSFTVSTDTGSTDNHENYAITYPATATASIFKADVDETKVTAPTVATGLEYTGLPLTLIAAGTVTEGGTMEYSVDNVTYSTALPTGTNAGNYDVWYRVKGDGNHNDTTGTKLTTDTSKVTIDKQTVDTPTIEFTPSGATYDGQEHRPTVKVLDAHGRVIPDSEYTVSYGDTDWKTEGNHTVTITGKADGNYSITGDETARSKTFTILPAGQSPLSIAGQPGEVRYGDVFALSANGGSGAGAVTWESSDEQVAYVNSQTGRVEIKKAGGPVTITARKAAGGGYAETTATWTFSAEKKPVTAIVTAKDKVYDTTDKADLVITWTPGDLVGNDTIDLSTVLTGAFDDANVGENKTVRITGTVPVNDKYTVTYNNTTTASITATKATVSGVNSGPWTYSGSEQPLLQNGAATNGTIVYSRNGVDFMETSPTETNAGKYTVYYKARGNTNYADSDVRMVEVTIQPKTVSSPAIELSPETFEYDGTAKKPDVVVKDGSTVISAVEYTVSYSNNINKGTATVTISDNAGGNYTVSGSTTFTITAGKATLTTAPQAKVLTYTGASQELVSRGAADNGTVVYSQTETGSYTTTVPRQTNAGNYEVWYKVQNTDGTDATSPQYLPVTIARKQISPDVFLEYESIEYTGSPCTPGVDFVVDSDEGMIDPNDYTVNYSGHNKVGTAKVLVAAKSTSNYKFSVIVTFEITKAKAKFTTPPTAIEPLKYNGMAQTLVNPGDVEGGTAVYSLNGVNYSMTVPTAIDRGSYTVYAKVQGDSTHEDSEVVQVSVTIGVNTLSADQLTVSLSATSFPYTGGEVKPTVTVADRNGNVISADEYTVTYSDNVNMGTAKITIKSKTGGNYSFMAEKTFTIVDASQTPLAITGKQDAVYYGDTLSLSTTGGGSGTVAWSETGPVTKLVDGQYKINSSGSVTITATKGSSTDTWTFYAQPKPVTATVTAANKVYDGSTNADMTVTLNGLLPGESVTNVTAQGQFTDANVGTNKTVTITAFNVPTEVSAKYDISYPATVTASITPAPAAVTAAPTLATGPLTYNGSAQALLANDGTAADGGNLMYSLDGKDYSYSIPTGTDAKTYTVWYKVEAADDNHKDSAAVKLGDVIISANIDPVTVLCTPSTIQYDGRSQTPTVVVRDSQQRIIPESEYTVTFEPDTRIAVGKYKVTVTDKPGGNYQFSAVTKEDAFEIVSASQNPLSIVTDIPTDVHYGDTFRLSAMGGSGNGAIQWSIAESSVATVNANGVVTVTGTGGFTVKAYREASDGYSDSNTDSVPFEAKAKPVTPLVTASDKSYDGKVEATLTATWKSGDLVSGDTITLTVEGAFATADAGNNKRVNITGHTATGTNQDKYAITWPDSTTASIYKVDAKLATAPVAADLTYNGSAQNLIADGTGTTVGNIGTVVYSTSQNGTYSTTIPTGTSAGKYEVWYRVADSVNYTGIAPASIQVEIKKANPGVTTQPTASGTAGQKLSEIQLNGGATSAIGKFAWASPETEAAAGTAYNVIFTPNDTANYNTVTFTLTPVSAPSNGGSGGNGTGSGSGGGSGTSTPSTPDSASLQTTVRNGAANTVLSASGGHQLVQQAVAAQSDNIVIQPEITSSVTKAAVSIPASTASQINSQTDADLTVASPIASVTIPNAALNTLGSAGGTVDVVTEQVDGAVAVTLSAGGEKVDSVPGGVTLTVPAQDATPGTVAMLVNEDGTREVIRKSVVENGAVSVPLDGSATVEIVDNSKSFDDVSPTDWSADAIDFASSHELFNGTSETTFSPNSEMSRGMLATVLYNLEGNPDQDAEVTFSDIDSEAWYAEGVAWAAENGIVNGYGNGQYGPNDSVTREQFVVMLWKYAGSPEAGGDQDLPFTDADNASGYAVEALRWAVEKGILNGFADGRLAPGGTATRAQAAQLLKNFMEKA